MTKRDECIKGFFERGGRVRKDGAIVGPRGNVRTPRKLGKPGRLYYAINIYHQPTKTRTPVNVHRLVAYDKFGDAMFAAPCVRHLDDNPLNNHPDNLELGTHVDNAMDRPATDRVAHAKLAAAHITRKDWDDIERDQAAGMSFRDLAKNYGVSKGTLSRHFNLIPGWTSKKQFNFDWEVVRSHIAETNCSYASAARKFGCSAKSLVRHFGPRSTFVS